MTIRSITFILFCLFLVACGSEEQWPEDLDGKRKMLIEQQSTLKNIRENIDRLEKEISGLDDTPEKSRLVTTLQIEKKDFQHFVDIQATVQGDDVVFASSETGGRIIRLNLEEGQNVKRGQLIAVLDLETIQKQIDEVSISLDLASTVFDRQERLWKQNIGSEIQYLEAKSNKERFEKSLSTLNTQLNKGNVHSPISGVVDQKFKEPGEIVAPGEPIVQILNTRKVKVVASVPENYLGKVKKGEEVLVKFPALNTEHTERISLIGSSIHPANRTFSVEVEIDNKNGLYKPNLLALMLINDYQAKDAIVLPLELLQQEVSGRNYVMVVNEVEGKTISKKVYVETGLSYAGNIEITEGLEGNETIIVDGARGLANEELIQIQNSAIEKDNG